MVKPSSDDEGPSFIEACNKYVMLKFKYFLNFILRTGRLCKRVSVLIFQTFF